ncbi:hypothetical protein [Pseudomonas viridiflava]|uniref:hypothetical protein n=1 Tax=Pseudomonas viridiflava TaxID=33069 RepID=UPI001C31611B|nr:hypothetical protein [Pseudomonas viridiflava]QXG42223.1 hypothetical protein KTT55_06920 [Pseudomonas viridiflava]
MDDETWLRDAEARIQQDPKLWAHLWHIRNPGLPPIDSLPQPGDVIRDNISLCELIVKKVIHTVNGIWFDCNVIDWQTKTVTHHKCYHNGFDLVNGRLLSRLKYSSGMSGFNIYNRGQDELFILRRARGQLELFA